VKPGLEYAKPDFDNPPRFLAHARVAIFLEVEQMPVVLDEGGRHRINRNPYDFGDMKLLRFRFPFDTFDDLAWLERYLDKHNLGSGAGQPEGEKLLTAMEERISRSRPYKYREFVSAVNLDRSSHREWCHISDRSYAFPNVDLKEHMRTHSRGYRFKRFLDYRPEDQPMTSNRFKSGVRLTCTCSQGSVLTPSLGSGALSQLVPGLRAGLERCFAYQKELLDDGYLPMYRVRQWQQGHFEEQERIRSAPVVMAEIAELFTPLPDKAWML